jgi:hypothetical protein
MHSGTSFMAVSHSDTLVNYSHISSLISRANTNVARNAMPMTRSHVYPTASQQTRKKSQRIAKNNEEGSELTFNGKVQRCTTP